MANALNGEVEVTIDGAPYTLRFGINELCAVQADLGLSADDPEFMLRCASMAFVRSYSGLRIAFHRALQTKHPDTTIETAGDLITGLGFVNAVNAVCKCMEWAMPPQKETKGKGGDPRPSPGPTS